MLFPNNKGDAYEGNNMMKQQQLKIPNESILEDRNSGVGCLLLLSSSRYFFFEMKMLLFILCSICGGGSHGAQEA